MYIDRVTIEGEKREDNWTLQESDMAYWLIGLEIAKVLLPCYLDMDGYKVFTYFIPTEV